MSIDSGRPDLRMPANSTATDAIGIRYQGPILSGKLGVHQAFQEQARALSGLRKSSLPPLASAVKLEPAPVVSPPPNATDHLVSVDPVMDYHRSQFGCPPSTTYVHPEQYDAVLRSHLGMAPPPDPYEARRQATTNWQAIRDQKVV